MKAQIIVLFFSAFCTFSVFAQKDVKPTILRQVYSEKVRDAKLEAAIFSAVALGVENDDTRYYYNRVDLNGDKIPEVLVYVFGRIHCGTGGCDALLFQKTGNKYKRVARFGPVRNPIIVSQYKTNGWNDLIFFNRGGGINPGYYSVCRFDGQNYPSNPTVEREASRLTTKVKGTAYLVENINNKSGLEFGKKQ